MFKLSGGRRDVNTCRASLGRVQSGCINCQSQIKHLDKGPQWQEQVSPTRSRRRNGVLVHEVRRSRVITADYKWVGQEGGTEPECGCTITLRSNLDPMFQKSTGFQKQCHQLETRCLNTSTCSHPFTDIPLLWQTARRQRSQKDNLEQSVLRFQKER